MFRTIYDQLRVVFRAGNQIHHAVDPDAVLSSSAGAGSYDDPLAALLLALLWRGRHKIQLQQRQQQRS